MKLSIFTPCYNRAHCLPRLYESLCRQTSRDFEWLIIDDGSTDNTSEVVRAMLAEEKVNIRYFYKENGGKHTAHNLALEKAAGDFFFCVDSDDWLSVNAVECILSTTENLYTAVGLLGYKAFADGTRLSEEFTADKIFTKMHKLPRGEYSVILKTEIARKYPFPVFGLEKFIGECVVYDQIDQVYDLRLLPSVVTI